MKRIARHAVTIIAAGIFLAGAAGAREAQSADAARSTLGGDDARLATNDGFSLEATPPATVAAAVDNATTARRLNDTAPAERFAPDLDRAFRRTVPGGSGVRQNASPEPLQVNLVFHVLSGPSLEGDLGDGVLAAQVAVLNDAYRTSGLHFNVAEVRRYPGSAYFAGGCFPTTEAGLRMKSELAVDPTRFVNIYTCRLALPFIAGYGTLPNEFPESDRRHGVVIDYGAVTGSAPPLELGHTLVHELGHYFGLLHTFQGGCAEPGDGISDTPAEALQAFGCDIGRDTCPQAGADPVSNFMDYSADSCTDHFTPLQEARMRALIAAFRPGLTGAAFSIGPGMTGNWYDPSAGGHGFSVEVLPGNQMLAQWYVFAPDAGQVWIIAMGPITSDTAVLQGYREDGAGARFPPNFDPGRLQAQPWGTLTLTFTDCNNGQVSWQSVAPGYASGSIPITRLTMPAGLTCP